LSSHFFFFLAFGISLEAKKKKKKKKKRKKKYYDHWVMMVENHAGEKWRELI